MEEIQYIGESLWQGQLAHFLILLSFFSAAFAAFAYYKSTQFNIAEQDDQAWSKLGRIGFITHGLSTITVIAMLFYLMIAQRFEYAYVFQHVSSDLPIQYIFSAFWEGQEGSFMLWMFWHIILGFVLLRTAKNWESPVMSILSVIQFILASMILGTYVGFGDYLFKWGINPTLLLRDTLDAPIFSNADYLSSIKGTGLNPLLQNYWNTIHPPTLFLGFASTAIPFCYALAGMWTKKHTTWLKPALNWALFSGFILGLGILMGGAWAYEALTFGGYWAWDPVENMSLVPWLFLVAGIHCHLIANASGYSIKSTYLFYILTFVFILYSTFLTRSGVLGDTSVHAFTDLGLEWQLVFFVSFFASLGFGFFIKTYKSIPEKEKEEATSSREFWMYIGSLVLLFSGMIISYSTSLPVYNKVMEFFNEDFVGRVINDPVPHYNKYQVWIAVFISLLSSVAIYLRYKRTPEQQLSHVLKLVGGATAVSAILSYLSVDYFNLYTWQYVALAFFAYLAVLLNTYYILVESKRNKKLLASATSHFGFALMIVGILSSGLNESVITKNPFAMQGLMKNEDLAKAVKLIKGKPMFSEGYWLNYHSDTVVGNMKLFAVDFKKMDEEGNTEDQFTLYPNVLYSNDFQKVAATNPDTKHYLNRDIFTNIFSLPSPQMDVKFAKEMEDTLKYEPYEFYQNDTLFTKRNQIIVKEINLNPNHDSYQHEKNDFGIELVVEVSDLSEKEPEICRTALGVKDNLVYNYPHQSNEFGIKMRLEEGFLNEYFTPEESLVYTEFQVQAGESFEFGGKSFVINGFKKEPENPRYTEVEGDIAVEADLQVKTDKGQYQLEPVFIIRDMNPYGLKDYNIETGIHARFTFVDPKTETYTISLAQDQRKDPLIVLSIAEDVPRTDFIVLEAKVVPGINMFWLGSLMMIFGLLFGLINRYRIKS